MKWSVLAVVVACVSAACAAPSRASSGSLASRATSPAPPSASLASAAGTREKVFCQMEKPTGSNLSRKVCRTQDQIDAESQAAQDAIHLMLKSGATMRP